MTSGVLKIKWYGPYQFVRSKQDDVFTNPIWNYKGVYLWAIPLKTEFLTYYVGETGKSFAERHIQHLDCYITGFYRVYDPEQFSKGNRKLIWGGMWKPDRKNEDV